MSGPVVVKNEAESPVLSVVIAAHNAAAVIARCLAALCAQAGPGRVEVIVADSSTDGTTEAVRTEFPSVHLLHFDQPLTIPQLRGKGIAVAQGQIIAILDPFSVVARDWSSQLIKAHRERPNLAIGGAVELYDAESRSLADWATYLNEYGLFTPPVAEGEVNLLPGSNISYKRRALFDGQRPAREEFWKTFVNWEIERTGSPLWLAPGMVVRLWKPVRFWDFFRTRYDHGRCFAAMRAARAGRLERLLRAATAPLLPALLLWRLGCPFWTKRRYRLKFAATAPLQLLLLASWACGEMAGYWRGSGRSCSRLFY